MPVFAAVGAVMGGIALAEGVATGFALMGALEAIASVGAVVSGIGVVTGNEDLAKIGGTMGLVGGLGSMVNKAGLLGTADEALNASAALEDARQGAAMTANTANEATTVVNGIITTPEINVQNPEGEARIGGVDPSVSVNPVDAQTTKAIEAAGAAPGDIAKAAMKSPMNETDSLINWAQKGQAPTPVDSSIWGGMKGLAGEAMDWAKKNQTLASGMLQVGGQFMAGLFDPTVDVKKDYLKAQTELATAQTRAANQQNANMSAPAPRASTTGTRAPVYRQGPAPVYVPPGVGLINTVTGRV